MFNHAPDISVNTKILYIVSYPLISFNPVHMKSSKRIYCILNERKKNYINRRGRMTNAFNFLFNMDMKLLMKQTNRKIQMHWSLDGQKLMLF